MPPENAKVAFVSLPEGGSRSLPSDHDSSSLTSDSTSTRRGLAPSPFLPSGISPVSSSAALSTSFPRRILATRNIAEAEWARRSRSSPATHRQHSPTGGSHAVTSNKSTTPIRLHSQKRAPTGGSSRATSTPQTSDILDEKLVATGSELSHDEDGTSDGTTQPGNKGYGTYPVSMDDESSQYSSSPPPGQGSLQRLAEQYTRLRNQKMHLWDILDGIRSRREQVQTLRHEKDEADRAFMTRVQALLPDLPALDQLFKRMQTATLQCQEAEQRFDDLIDDLQSGQADLEYEETRFYTAAAGTSRTSSSAGSATESSPRILDDPLLRGISGDRPDDVHPLLEELRETTSDLHSANELLANTRMKRTFLLKQRPNTLGEESFHMLDAYGDAGRNKALQIRQEERMTQREVDELQNYENLERKAVVEIGTLTTRVKLLQDECLQKGIVPGVSRQRQADPGVDDVYREDIDLNVRLFGGDSDQRYPRKLAHPIFPTLLSNPIHLLDSFPRTPEQSLRMALSLPPTLPTRQTHIDEAAREVTIHSLLTGPKMSTTARAVPSEASLGTIASAAPPDRKIDFINRWLLHKLHLSVLEAEVLWTTFRMHLKILDLDSWQQDVLRFWDLDQAANPAHSDLEKESSDHSFASILQRPQRCCSDSGLQDRPLMRDWDIDEAWA
ncbi:hypothetical protein F4780DRAFT_735690 [Xylariomycetidae sp. FL0641]|nr:hypothetical protein F4780DRAFT_735690 [Xylariomycetidae sp. FL0641]